EMANLFNLSTDAHSTFQLGHDDPLTIGSTDGGGSGFGGDTTTVGSLGSGGGGGSEPPPGGGDNGNNNDQPPGSPPSGPPPVGPVLAVNDSGTTSEDGKLTVNVANGVLANDTHDAGDAIHVTAVNGDAAAVGNQITLASGAKLTLNADGSYS